MVHMATIERRDGTLWTIEIIEGRADGAFRHHLSAAWYRFQSDGVMTWAEDAPDEALGMGKLVAWDGEPVEVGPQSLSPAGNPMDTDILAELARLEREAIEARWIIGQIVLDFEMISGTMACPSSALSAADGIANLIHDLRSAQGTA